MIKIYAKSPITPIEVLCCNECAHEIGVFEGHTPKICPQCNKPFIHGWKTLWVIMQAKDAKKAELQSIRLDIEDDPV